MHKHTPIAAAAALIAAAAFAPSARATVVTYAISANGIKEVSAAGTPNQGDVDGSAIGTIRFDNGTGAGSTGSAVINLTLANLDVGTLDLTGHHIHQAPATTTGAIVIDFGDPDTIRTGSTLSGTITGLPAATITSLFAAPTGFYYNLHNAQFTGGAVRDQLGTVVVPEPTGLSLAAIGAAAFLRRRRSATTFA
jgi:MYXO-CTERM domain-containing protein